MQYRWARGPHSSASSSSYASRDIHLIKRAFLFYVRPIVEHNSVIWWPYTAQDIDAIESVQAIANP